MTPSSAAPNGPPSAGYAHADYAAALAEFGNVRFLPRSGGWLLERPIPGTSDRDAMGCYPLFSCPDWRGLTADLADVGTDLVSVVLVADPFGNHDTELLGRTFNRGAVPFKEHQVVDLSQPLETIVSSHHRRNVRRAQRLVQAERVADATSVLDEWAGLYDTLIRRHAIEGLRAFSRSSFARQLATPGLVAYRALCENETVGMLLFYVQGDVAYYHLGAYSERGYQVGAAFALFWEVLRDLSRAVRLVSLGGDAGVAGGEGGLGRFKKGWATGSRQAFLCRHIGNVERYEELSDGASDVAFFPSYRGPVTLSLGETKSDDERSTEGV